MFRPKAFRYGIVDNPISLEKLMFIETRRNLSKAYDTETKIIISANNIFISVVIDDKLWSYWA